MTHSNTVRSFFLLSLVFLLTTALFIATAEAREHDTSDRDTARDESRDDVRDAREDRGREEDDESNTNNGSTSANQNEGSSSVSVSISVTASDGETVHKIVENVETTGNGDEHIVVHSSNTLDGDADSRHEGGIVRVTQSSVDRHGR